MKDLIKYLLISFVFLFGVTMDAKEGSYKYVIYVNEIVKSFAESMEEELNLVCVGSGGQMSRDVDVISVKFMHNKPVSMEEARSLEVISVQNFLDKINSHQDVRPFLRKFPFNQDHVQVSVSFVDENTGDYFDGIAYSNLINGAITYYRFDKEEDDLIEIAEEPYEEALKKCQN